MRRIRTLDPVLPSETDRHAGLAYTLWLPDRPRDDRAGVVILHGADSVKEGHHDFARVVRAAGLAAICFDLRGHGVSEGELDDRVAEDVATMAALMRSRIGAVDAPVAIRGSSMGGYLSIVAASSVGASVVVAICPAPAELLRAGLSRSAFRFAADRERLDRFLAGHDLHGAVAELTVPLLILHAAGDERVPVEHSRELAEAFSAPGSRLIVLPGGHHRSIQHDRELQAVSLRFIEQALAGGAGPASPASLG